MKPSLPFSSEKLLLLKVIQSFLENKSKLACDIDGIPPSSAAAER
jgi:hypothetical protein